MPPSMPCNEISSPRLRVCIRSWVWVAVTLVNTAMREPSDGQRAGWTKTRIVEGQMPSAVITSRSLVLSPNTAPRESEPIFMCADVGSTIKWCGGVSWQQQRSRQQYKSRQKKSGYKKCANNTYNQHHQISICNPAIRPRKCKKSSKCCYWHWSNCSGQWSACVSAKRCLFRQWRRSCAEPLSKLLLKIA